MWKQIYPKMVEKKENQLYNCIKKRATSTASAPECQTTLRQIPDTIPSQPVHKFL